MHWWITAHNVCPNGWIVSAIEDLITHMWVYDQEYKLLEIGFEDPADVSEISIIPARLPATSKTPSAIRRLFQQHDLTAASGNRTFFPAAVAAPQVGDHCALNPVR
jgi:hypothetical protein